MSKFGNFWQTYCAKILFMKAIQPKTLELLIISSLKCASPRAVLSFNRLFEHFIDEDFIYGLNHVEIISVIYKSSFYKYYKVSTLFSRLNLDNKALLCRRKEYLKLFAKYYLNLTTLPKNVFGILYDALTKDLHNIDAA